MKKIFKTLGIVSLILFSSWVIGQELKEKREAKDNIAMEQGLEGESVSDEESSSDTSISPVVETTENEDLGDENSLMDYLVFEGTQATEDNPWKQTAGLFEMEGMGEVIFLTPNTSVVMEEITESLNVECQIHPWVKENSDGAGVLIWLMDKEENIVHEEKWKISSEEEWQEFSVDVTLYEGVEKIKLICNNGENNDDSGDWVVIKETSRAAADFIAMNDGEYVRSATYFGDEWPINFWNSELDDLQKDMEQIKKDGFNSIILVVPWREFQPTTEPVSYNEYAFENLNTIMQAANDKELDVYLRIGYTWDFYKDRDDDIVNRFYNLLGDESVQDAWYDYVQKVYTEADTHGNFKGSFLTWEDFWNVLGICDEELVEDRIQKAEFVGYQEWVEQEFSLEEYNLKYGTNYSEYEEIPVPKRNEPAMEAMYSFYDNFLNHILVTSQEIIPNLSMEVRLDWDVIYQLDGSVGYYDHKNTFECAKSNFTSTMYGIPMGFENNGERVSYQEALEKTEYILANLKANNGGKAVYIEQFIFADNTPLYKNNAQIKEDELNLYLENVADVLLEYSEGYGIWTYRNYCANMVYNSQFALGNCGWSESENVSYNEVNNSKVCNLSEGEWIRQEVAEIRNHFDSDKYTFEISVVELQEPTVLKINVGNNVESLQINTIGKYFMEFQKGDSFDITIENVQGNVSVDDIKLYSQIQQGFLYDENNDELLCISGIRELNRKLAK